MSELNARLLGAHAAGDKSALVSLYKLAADQVPGTQAESFFLTHAYVFALEIGSSDAPALRQRLIDLGCESPLHPASINSR